MKVKNRVCRKESSNEEIFIFNTLNKRRQQKKYGHQKLFNEQIKHKIQTNKIMMQKG